MMGWLYDNCCSNMNLLSSWKLLGVTESTKEMRFSEGFLVALSLGLGTRRGYEGSRWSPRTGGRAPQAGHELP